MMPVSVVPVAISMLMLVRMFMTVFLLLLRWLASKKAADLVQKRLHGVETSK